MKNVFYLSFGLGLLLLFVGCSKGIMITGTVKYSDGKPLTHGSVVFDSKTDSFFGMIDKNGNYATGALKENQEIPPGLYKVWISGTQKEVGADPIKETRGEIVETVARPFTSASRTPLTFEVKSGGPKTFDIVVERP